MNEFIILKPEIYKTQLNWPMPKTLTTYKSTKPFTFKQKEGFFIKTKAFKKPNESHILLYFFS